MQWWNQLNESRCKMCRPWRALCIANGVARSRHNQSARFAPGIRHSQNSRIVSLTAIRKGKTPNLFAAGYELEPRGVGGWLAFFCLTLTLFGPLTNLRIAIKALINLAEHPIGLPTEFRLASVAVVYAGLSGVQRPRGLSLVAGRAQRSGNLPRTI